MKSFIVGLGILFACADVNAMNNSDEFANIGFEEGSQLEGITAHAFVDADVAQVAPPNAIPDNLDGINVNLANIGFEEGSRLETIGAYAFNIAALAEIEIEIPNVMLNRCN